MQCIDLNNGAVPCANDVLQAISGDETLRPQDTSAPRLKTLRHRFRSVPRHFGTAFRNLHVSSRQPINHCTLISQSLSTSRAPLLHLISCYFLDCKSASAAGHLLSSGAIASVQTFTFIPRKNVQHEIVNKCSLRHV